MKKRDIFVVCLLLAFAGRYAAAVKCTISGTGVSFGNYTGNAIGITGTLAVYCNGNADYAIGLNAGTGTGATDSNRFMTGPGSIQYGLFSNASYTANWGNTSGTGWVTGQGNQTTQNITVYALIPANQYAQPGTYVDQITATLSGPAFSAISTTFSVTATVQNTCSISATDLAFGTYSGALINATSTLTVTCTNSTTYNIGLNAGTAAGATVTSRSMTGPSSTLLGYRLLRDASRTVNWGNTVGSDTVVGTGTGAPQSLVIYGQLPAKQQALPGTYTDTITATITY